MSSRTDALRAQLALAEAEDALSDAKAAVNTPQIEKLREKVRAARSELAAALADGPDLTALKEQVRQARLEYRQARDAAATAEGDDD